MNVKSPDLLVYRILIIPLMNFGFLFDDSSYV